MRSQLRWADELASVRSMKAQNKEFAVRRGFMARYDSLCCLVLLLLLLLHGAATAAIAAAVVAAVEGQI